MRIIIDENGNEIDTFAEKNDKIKEELQEVIAEFQRQQLADKSGRKKFGFQLLMQIEDKLGLYGRLKADEVVNLTADDIEDYWWSFHSLMAYFNRYFEIVPNRQTFMLYVGINSREYRQLTRSEDEEIRSVMSFIEDRLVGKGWSAGESGNANDKAILNRLKATDEHGHGVITATESKVISAVTQKTPLELQRELLKLVGGENNK